MPQVTDTLALLYNKKLLTEAGIDQAPPRPGTSSSTTALAIKAKTGTDGLFLNAGSYFLLPFIYGEGGDLVDAANKKITVNRRQAVKAIGVAQDLVTSGAAVKPP